MAQMPEEGERFKIVDNQWRNMIKKAVAEKTVDAIIEIENMLPKLTESLKLLDIITKGLNAYLETKRLYFPRFFFLSNEELLGILSLANDPIGVQIHLTKVFEGINRLEMDEHMDIHAMISPQKEKVLFNQSGQDPINPNNSSGSVEKWLLEVEDMMRVSMWDTNKATMLDHEQQDRLTWIGDWPQQSVLAINSMFWTRKVEEYIEKEGQKGIKKYADICTEELLEIVNLVRTKIPKLMRKTCGALVTMDVHGRDLLRDQMGEVTSKYDFDWLAQLRYYWEDKSENMFGNEGLLQASIINARLEYQGEYIGVSGRLVITPLTDRCYRTLMGAVYLNLGGAPEGPAGTGKTETVKDMSKALGMLCIVYNCSDQLDYLAMAKFFKGLVGSGAFACFDEFNRIDLEVLSVVAQQVLQIQNAKNAHLTEFMFEGTQVKIRDTCNCFITMNPGYAGRSELPDNLKVLFRTVAMMVPNYAMIAEIILYSGGYLDARNMARKITSTYRLCSEQLSSQYHYDYGLRAVISVLMAARNLKQLYPDEDESVLVLRATLEVNEPKFLQLDMELFKGIINDLFPGVKLPKKDNDDLVDALKAEASRRNLQWNDYYAQKCVQIYEMMLVRHGFMIVGEPFAAKTAAYAVVAAALGELRSANKMEVRFVFRSASRWKYCCVWSLTFSLPPSFSFPTVFDVTDDSGQTQQGYAYHTQCIVLNPKSITMGQLYGQNNAVSLEWEDGVLSTKFRDAANNKGFEPEDRKWLVLDGPVDAIWIENMNTVLDDNKKLCLISGEIISMSDKMNMIFEPMDLAVASPATVSRCGIVFHEPHMMGWRPLFTVRRQVA